MGDVNVYETLSPGQYKVLAILPIPAAILSIVGSSAIIYMVARSRRQREWTPYKRLLFGMSVCDIILSINAAIGNFMRPESTSPRVWAFGNEATCTASGVLGQFSLSAILYNGMLSFYFLLSARFGWKNGRIARCVEPVMHVFCLGFPLVTAAIGAGLGVFSEPVMGLGCQINDYPRGCGEGPGNNGETCLSILIAWIFVGMPRILNGFLIVVNNLVIFIYVWRQARPNKPRIHKNNSAKSAENTSSDDNSSQCNPENAQAPRLQTKKSKSVRDTSKPEVRPPTQSPRFQCQTMRSTRDSFENDRISMNVEMSSRTLRPDGSKNPRKGCRKPMTEVEEDQLRRLQLVRSQAVLFVGSYFVSNIWVGLTSFLESISPTDEDEYAMAALCFPMLVLYAIFVPLQGFFNMLIYMRPKYAKYRTHFPDEPRLWAFWLTLTGEDSPRLRNKNREESVDPYSPQNQSKTGNKTPLPASRGEQQEASQVQHSKRSEVGSPLDVAHCHRSSSALVHSEAVWTKDEYSPEQEYRKGCSEKFEAEKEDMDEKPTMWEPIHKARRHISSLKGSSLEVISEMSEMSFDAAAAAAGPEDDRWNAGSKLSNCSPKPLVVPKRPESMDVALISEEVEDLVSLPVPSSKCSFDSPISCPQRRLSPLPIEPPEIL